MVAVGDECSGVVAAEVVAGSARVADAHQYLLVAQLEEIRAGAVLVLVGPVRIRVVERSLVVPMFEIRRGEQVGGVADVMGFDTPAENHVVDAVGEPDMGIEDPVHVEGGVASFGLDDDRVGGMAAPGNEIVVFGVGDADARVHTVVDESRDTLPGNQRASREDAWLGYVGSGLERRRMEPPVHEVRTRCVAPAVPTAWESRILEYVEQVIAPTPVERPVRDRRAHTGPPVPRSGTAARGAVRVWTCVVPRGYCGSVRRSGPALRVDVARTGPPETSRDSRRALTVVSVVSYRMNRRRGFGYYGARRDRLAVAAAARRR